MSNMDSSTFLKGLGVGMVVGSAVGMAVHAGKSGGKKAWGRALKSMGDVVENVTDILGF